MGDMNHS